MNNVELNTHSSNNVTQRALSTESNTQNNYLEENLNITFIIKSNNIREEINMKLNDYLKDLSIFVVEKFNCRNNNYKLTFRNENGVVHILGKYGLYDDKDKISKVIQQNYIQSGKVYLELTHIIVEPISRFNLNRITCRICNINVANEVIMPCSHVIYCSGCIADRQYRGEFNYCGECGSQIEQTIRLRFNQYTN